MLVLRIRSAMPSLPNAALARKKLQNRYGTLESPGLRPACAGNCSEANLLLRLIDKEGLLISGAKDMTEAQKTYARSEDWTNKKRGLLGVVEEVKPNVLIGTSTVPKSFTEDVVRVMASNHDRPIILPLSNPTRLHEAVPADLLAWTGGKALVATGSPFKPVKGPWGSNREEVEIAVAECNNSVVFPGIGLGAVLSRAKLVTDTMLIEAVSGVAELSPALHDSTAPLLPGVDVVRKVSVRVARKVIQAAVAEGVATETEIPQDEEELVGWIREQMWDPVYRPLKYIEAKGASREAKGELRVVGSLSQRDRL